MKEPPGKGQKQGKTCAKGFARAKREGGKSGLKKTRGKARSKEKRVPKALQGLKERAEKVG